MNLKLCKTLGFHPHAPPPFKKGGPKLYAKNCVFLLRLYSALIIAVEAIRQYRLKSFSCSFLQKAANNFQLLVFNLRPENLVEPLHLLLEGHTTIVEHNGVVGLTQGADGAGLVEVVAVANVLHNLLAAHLLALGQ